MKARTKFMIGGAVVLAAAGWLMVTSIRETGSYYVTPHEYKSRIAATPAFRTEDVRLGAAVVPGTIIRAASGREYRFRVTDGGVDTIPVVYRGIAPDTFTDGVDVVVAGTLGADGTFDAHELLAKCASRYENAPEKYRQTPGYKAAKASGA